MNFIKLRNASDVVKTGLKSRFSLSVLCLWSYTEAFVFPIPPDPFLIALILANRNNFLLYTSLCTIFSILGGITGYYIGFVFWEELGVHITDYLALTDQVNDFKELFIIFFLPITAVMLNPFPIALPNIAISGLILYFK